MILEQIDKDLLKMAEESDVILKDIYKKIDNIADVIYINNGGIPLYLCNDRNKFELRAYFPRLSENCMNILAENKLKIREK